MVSDWGFCGRAWSVFLLPSLSSTFRPNRSWWFWCHPLWSQLWWSCVPSVSRILREIWMLYSWPGGIRLSNQAVRCVPAHSTYSSKIERICCWRAAVLSGFPLFSRHVLYGTVGARNPSFSCISLTAEMNFLQCPRHVLDTNHFDIYWSHLWDITTWWSPCCPPLRRDLVLLAASGAVSLGVDQAACLHKRLRCDNVLWLCQAWFLPFPLRMNDYSDCVPLCLVCWA